MLQIEKEEQAAAEKAVVKEEFQGEWSAPPAEFAQPEVADWAEGVAVPSVPIQQFPAGKISQTDSVRFIVLMSNTLNSVTATAATAAAAAAAAAAPPVKTGEVFSGEFVQPLLNVMKVVSVGPLAQCAIVSSLQLKTGVRSLPQMTGPLLPLLRPLTGVVLLLTGLKPFTMATINVFYTLTCFINCRAF